MQLRRRPRAQVKRIMEERASTLEYCAKELQMIIDARQPVPLDFLDFALLVQRFRDHAELTRKFADG